MQRRTAFLGAALAAFTSALALGAGAAHAQAYPERSIKLVVPYAPGGSADIAARLISDAWGKALGGSMFIENKAGAGGNLGVDAVAKAPADGYTIGLQTVSLAINPALTPKMPYDTLKDLAPVGMVASSQHVLVVNNNLPARNVKELLALLRSNPGKYTYGSAGSGSTFHMSPGFVLPGVVGGVCLLLALWGLQMLPINYAGLALLLLGIGFLVGEAFMSGGRLKIELLPSGAVVRAFDLLDAVNKGTLDGGHAPARPAAVSRWYGP